jgi:hypothetical protein
MRFFNPNKNFWKWAATLDKNKVIIECGCGDGDLVREMRAEKMKAIGIDPRYSLLNEPLPMELISAIIPMEAERAPLIKTLESNILVCRPCHSGFPREVARIKHAKSDMYYIGFEKNLAIDLRDIKIKQIKKYKQVGQEGELLFKVC